MHRRDFLQQLAGAALAGSCAAPLLAEKPAEPLPNTPPMIDTHQHLWDLKRLNVPWVHKAAEVLRRSYVTRDYLQAAKGLNIVKTVYMEVNVPATELVAEVELITKLCQSDEHPTAAAVIGGRPGEPAFADYIRPMAKNPFVKGVRQVLHGGTPRGYCLNEPFVKSIQLLGELGLSFDLCLRPNELSDAVRLVDQCPGTRFILDHCGNADPKAFSSRSNGTRPSHDPRTWRRDMAALATREHVVCKISGVVARAPQPNWTADDLAPVVNFCLDQFGPDRVVFGSDWPVCLVGAPLADWVAALKQIVKQRPLEHQKKLLHDNAQRIYGLQ
jgi:L-fuconolactonase